MMKTLLNLLIKLGLACSVLYIVLIAAAVLLDGQVFEFEKHHVFVKDMGIHIYNKQITHEFVADPNEI